MQRRALASALELMKEAGSPAEELKVMRQLEAETAKEVQDLQTLARTLRRVLIDPLPTPNEAN